jgi:hypothetical protein
MFGDEIGLTALAEMVGFDVTTLPQLCSCTERPCRDAVESDGRISSGPERTTGPNGTRAIRTGYF